MLLKNIYDVWNKHSEGLELRGVVKAQKLNNGFVTHHQFTLLREKKGNIRNVILGIAWLEKFIYW